MQKVKLCIKINDVTNRFSMEDKTDMMEDFDISSNKEEVKLVYEKYLKNNTI